MNRLKNEDYFFVNDDMFIVADGMGGHNAGEIASAMAVETIKTLIRTKLKLIQSEFINQEQFQQIIRDAILHTNDSIIQESSQYTQYQGMGTTIAIVVFQRPNRLCIANVGDSRIYLFRNHSLKQLSVDHTVTAAMIQKGLLTKHEALSHPYRHHLSQSLGINKKIEPYIQSISIYPADRLLLCSDGLNILSHQELTAALEKDTSLEDICNHLIAIAKSKNSQDNITCIILKIRNK
jgi:protein phosphatase